MRFEYCNTLQKTGPPYTIDIIKEDLTDHPLYPLTQGRPVILVPKITGRVALKRRNKEIVYPVLWMAPVSLYGIEQEALMISIPVYGSVIVRPLTVKAMDLWQLGGMPMKACQTLAWHLNRVFMAHKV